MGQRFLDVHPTRSTSHYKEVTRYMQFSFRIDHIQRIRDIPNDKFSMIYIDKDQLHETHTYLESLISSLATQYLLEKNLVGTKYKSWTYFRHLTTIYDPIHLYPGYFLAKTSNPDDKISGYRTYSTFLSPYFYETPQPLACT